MIAPVPFTCHMCEEIVPHNNGNMSVPEICKQININEICMLCHHPKRHRTMPQIILCRNKRCQMKLFWHCLTVYFYQIFHQIVIDLFRKFHRHLVMNKLSG